MSRSFTVRVEAPESGQIKDVVTPVRGWITGSRIPNQIVLMGGNEQFAVKMVERPDVRRVFPDKQGIGFTGTIDYRGKALPNADFSVSLQVDGQPPTAIGEVKVLSVARQAASWAKIKRMKLDRIASHLACTACGSYLSPPVDGSFECQNCGTCYTRTETLIDLLPQDLRDEFRLVDTKNVSSHPYSSQAKELFQWAASRGGLTLDMGAGDQRYFDSSIICADIVPYPATDVVAVGQRLPFRDATFDAVYSNAVLEHVTDPFACAKELMRVLKPSGRIFCCVPFLQPEHGYPHHYYNMTQDGLVNLFAQFGAKLDTKEVPDWGHPLYTGQWFLSSYLQHLPMDDRLRMESLSISEFLKLRRSREEPIFNNLSQEGRRVIACATYATFHKPA